MTTAVKCSFLSPRYPCMHIFCQRLLSSFGHCYASNFDVYLFQYAEKSMCRFTKLIPGKGVVYVAFFAM